jgi:hypothetical protein
MLPPSGVGPSARHRLPLNAHPYQHGLTINDQGIVGGMELETSDSHGYAFFWTPVDGTVSAANLPGKTGGGIFGSSSSGFFTGPVQFAIGREAGSVSWSDGRRPGLVRKTRGVGVSREATMLKTMVVLFTAVVVLTSRSSPGWAERLMAWGSDASGQISQAPRGLLAVLASGGATQASGLRPDGTPVLWGGAHDPFSIPGLKEAPFAGESLVGVGLCRSHLLVIRRDGTLAGWGDNSYGQTDVPAGEFVAVDCGTIHSIGITRAGSLVGWGASAFPPLIDVPAGQFDAVSVRVVHSIALRSDGRLVGWGISPSAPGLPSIFATWTPDATRPADATPHWFVDGPFTAVASGNHHAIAMRGDGSVVGWGHNSGQGDVGNPLLAPPGVRFRAVAAGMGFSVGIDVDGTLWGWGTPLPPPPILPFVPWSFASLPGWTKYGDQGHYFFPGERFTAVSAAAMHFTAVTERGATD